VEVRVINLGGSFSGFQSAINTALTNNPGYGLLEIPLLLNSGSGDYYALLGRKA
jgi:hypothetical protein